jgi:hypothetical protein
MRKEFAMKKNFKVRFHLASGENYKKWQVKVGSDITYYDPESTSIVMKVCRLRNSKKIAMQINKGANKTVCAWIECEYLEIQKTSENNSSSSITYNPRIQPNWVENGKDVDNETYQILYTNGRGVYRPS